MASQGDEDLVASKTDGFKVGEKKTVEEYAKLGTSVPSFSISSYSSPSKSSHHIILIPSNFSLPIDQEDESLNRWKASLGISSSPALPVTSGDTRRCIIKSLALEVEGRSDITIDLSAPGAVDKLKEKPFTIKEGAKFRMKASFVVQHDVLSGLKYLQVVKRKGIRVGKDEEMIVSVLNYFETMGWSGKVRFEARAGA
jgi:Rho GDP-dissociation inhibitor